jgi:hypothetical protein
MALAAFCRKLGQKALCQRAEFLRSQPGFGAALESAQKFLNFTQVGMPSRKISFWTCSSIPKF